MFVGIAKPGKGQRRQTISRPVQTRVNERIRIREVRLIDENGEQVGIIPTFDALQMARERGLDLVEVAPNALPPVCRLMDYGKYRYEQSRKERESRRHQHVVELKEVRIRPKIDDHDLETKGRQAAKFLNAGDKVKLTVLFRGREMAHPDLGKALLDQLADQLRPHGTVEQPPRMEGRTMIMFMAPLKAKVSVADRERERDRASSNRDKEGTRAGEQSSEENENPQGGQEAV
jgi:translation initiation factor IF-3